MRGRAWLLIGYAAMTTTAVAPVRAHEVRPAYLEIVERENHTYDMLWKVPARGEMVLSISPSFDPSCEQSTPPAVYLTGGAQLSRWTMACGERGIEGRRISIEGLVTTTVDVLVKLELANGDSLSLILRPDDPSFVVETEASAPPLLAYLELGVEHILFGIDHLLFVLGLMLLVRDRWTLVKTITAFTIAHSITLAAATLGIVEVPQAPVEAVIALSIVFLACELVRPEDGHKSFARRFPWVIAFIFGLLHGFGFAGALREVGLPRAEIPAALLLFNVGVEVGQLLFVALLLCSGWLVKRALGRVPAWRVLAYGIGSTSAFWVAERVAQILRSSG